MDGAEYPVEDAELGAEEDREHTLPDRVHVGGAGGGAVLVHEHAAIDDQVRVRADTSRELIGRGKLRGLIDVRAGIGHLDDDHLDAVVLTDREVPIVARARTEELRLRLAPRSLAVRHSVQQRAHDGIGYFEVVASRKPGETKR